MRQKILLTALLASFLLVQNAWAVESEPNGTRATANTFALNSNNGGAIGTAGDEDYWKITTSADGKLDLTLNSANGIYIWIYLYDNNGTTILNSTTTNSSASISTDGLAKGTYYVRIVAFYSDQVGSYTISNTFTTPAQATDIEPNDVASQSLSLATNSTTTGHIGYYYKAVRDTFDWYKIVLPGDGKLKLKVASYNSTYLVCDLYDSDATTGISVGNSTSSSMEINADGLAAGTYYVRIRSFYTDGFQPYSLTDSFYAPLQANDVEPNNTSSQSIVLKTNKTVTGHIGYYNSGQRDLYDWYKITLPGDGKLSLNVSSHNSNFLVCDLYDGDATTGVSLNNATSSTMRIDADGLAAGTYYVRIRSYYADQFEPYTLTDSFYAVVQANDVEPNNTFSQAITLDPTTTVTGHLGYYYNSKRDTTDWYKIVLPQDGNLNLSMTSHNSHYIFFELFDNNGTRGVSLGNTANSTTSYNVDALSAGTYYVRVRMYYNSEFSPYTLTSTFTPYATGNDVEPNAYASQAKTMLANTANAGHVGFYRNGGTKDTTDWWKINYTGSGTLKLNATMSNSISTNAAYYFWLQVYKDTAGAPIYSGSLISNSGDINLTSLTQGYYYVKLYMYYTDQFGAYTITPTYDQVNIAKVNYRSSVTSQVCDSANSITYKCFSSQRPYTLQLYRFGVLYKTYTITNTQDNTISNLPEGQYNARVYGDGATGNAYATSATTTLLPVPTNLSVNSVQATKVHFNWVNQPCINYYTVRFRATGATKWQIRKTNGNVAGYTLNGLVANTTYEWQVASTDTANGITAIGTYSVADTFTTAAAFAGVQSAGDMSAISATENISDVQVYPNPATSFVTIQLNGGKTSASIRATLQDMYGKIVWSSGNTTAAALAGYRIDVSKFVSGIYMLHITDASNQLQITKKVVVAK